jgi:hypothetical protein
MNRSHGHDKAWTAGNSKEIQLFQIKARFNGTDLHFLVHYIRTYMVTQLDLMRLVNNLKSYCTHTYIFWVVSIRQLWLPSVPFTVGTTWKCSDESHSNYELIINWKAKTMAQREREMFGVSAARIVLRHSTMRDSGVSVPSTTAWTLHTICNALKVN